MHENAHRVKSLCAALSGTELTSKLFSLFLVAAGLAFSLNEETKADAFTFSNPDRVEILDGYSPPN